jgi:hypothetical protein
MTTKEQPLSAINFTLKKDAHGAMLRDGDGRTIARFADEDDADKVVALLNEMPSLRTDLENTLRQRQSSARQWRESFDVMHQRAMAGERHNEKALLLLDEIMGEDTTLFDEKTRQYWRSRMQLKRAEKSLLHGDYIVLKRASSKDFSACLSRACQLGFILGDRLVEVGMSGIRSGDYAGLQVHEGWVLFYTKDDRDAARELSYDQWLGTEGVPLTN